MMVRKLVYFIRFEVFTAVTMKNGVFWVVTPCDTILHSVLQFYRYRVENEEVKNDNFSFVTDTPGTKS
jgi:hypothetical protein